MLTSCTPNKLQVDELEHETDRLTAQDEARALREIELEKVKKKQPGDVPARPWQPKRKLKASDTRNPLPASATGHVPGIVGKPKPQARA